MAGLAKLQCAICRDLRIWKGFATSFIFGVNLTETFGYKLAVFQFRDLGFNQALSRNPVILNRALRASESTKNVEVLGLGQSARSICRTLKRFFGLALSTTNLSRFPGGYDAANRRLFSATVLLL